MNELFSIAGHFIDPKTIENIQPLGNGLINDTYKIMLKGETKPKYVLQRINTAVFTDVLPSSWPGYQRSSVYPVQKIGLQTSAQPYGLRERRFCKRGSAQPQEGHQEDGAPAPCHGRHRRSCRYVS